jgi:uncharacterized membrane protein YhaH (DUF805 family)
VSFTDAIKDGFRHYAKFGGRASRRAFWWWVLFWWLIDVATNLTLQGFGSSSIPLLGLWLALLLPSISVSIRRLHDSNRTGWWILIGLIPLIGWLALLIMYLNRGDEAANRFGPPPAEGVAATT